MMNKGDEINIRAVQELYGKYDRDIKFTENVISFPSKLSPTAINILDDIEQLLIRSDIKHIIKEQLFIHVQRIAEKLSAP